MNQRFWEPYKDRIVMVGIDPASEDYPVPNLVGDFVSNLDVNFPVGVEEPATPNYKAFNSNYVGTNPYPIDVLVDKTGKIRYVAREYDPTAMTAMLDILLAE